MFKPYFTFWLQVQEIVGVRTKGGKKDFLIRWKGFDESEDTWEPEENLDCPELIEAYLKEHKDEIEVAQSYILLIQGDFFKVTSTDI